MKKTEKIKKLAAELLANLGVEKYQLEVKEEKDEGRVMVAIETEEPGLLIGFRGKNLAAFQLILGLMINSALGEWQPLVVDVNHYRQEREEKLREMARQAAETVRSSGEKFVFSPLPPYERRLLHLFLADDPTVETLSEGEGRERRVVVFPKKT